MRAHMGDLIEIESERVARSGRRGVIEEVLREEPPRLRVRRDASAASRPVRGDAAAEASRASAASKARSAGRSEGRGCCRLSTTSWCRSTSNSTSLANSLRRSLTSNRSAAEKAR
jgi:hypothetical protein